MLKVKPCALLAWALLVLASSFSAAQNSTPPALPGAAQTGGANGSTSGKAPAAAGANDMGGDSKSAGTAARETATGTQTESAALAPSAPPAKVFARPRIGLALGGGGALALSEVGVLEWFEQNHIPVDVVAGTSMGCMVSALYSTGLTPAELEHVMDDKVFAQVFTFSNSYQSRSFRRREDARELPNGINIGLKHGVSFRNAVLTDQGLNAFLDRHFLRYDDRTDFNALPIPLRCISTDLNEARSVTFSRGSIPDAIRASVSLPGIFQPFELSGHEYVDGGVLDNLPTSSVHDMQADVVLAVSLPLAPVGKGDLNSLLGVLGRSFAVAIEAQEREQRKGAAVVIMPDISGFGATDYLKTTELAKRGYAAAEAHSAALRQYSLNDADWAAYLVHRASLRRGPAGPVLRVRISAPNDSTERAVQRIFAPLVNKPVDTAKIEAMLDQVRSDGRYEADYTVGYETEQQFEAQQAGLKPVPKGVVEVKVATSLAQLPPEVATTAQTGDSGQKEPGAANAKPGTGETSNQPGVATTATTATTATQLADKPTATGLAKTQELSAQSLANIAARPVILVTVTDKKTGPPNLLLGANVEAQAGGITRATVEGILINQDFGGYGAELRTHFALGSRTEITSEYFRPLSLLATPQHTYFVAPHGGIVRQPYAIYANQNHIADRELQTLSVGGDLGWTNERTQEVRAGVDFEHIGWSRTIGADALPDVFGVAQRARVLYNFDTQDRALVPQFGVHAKVEGAYLYDAVASPNAAQISGEFSVVHRFRFLEAAADAHDKALGRSDSGRNLLILAGEFGTEFNRNVAEPFRYSLGGPVRLFASAIDQYRGTDYWLAEPALLRRIAQLPQPLGQSFYLGLGLEGGQVFSPNSGTITRADAFLGIVAETPLGIITLGPAVGTNGERKFVFTLGKLF